MKNYMLVKKMPKKKFKKEKAIHNVKPTQQTEDNHNAILEVGFGGNADLLLQNPFIDRQKGNVNHSSGSQNYKFGGKDLSHYKNLKSFGKLEENKEDSLKPHLTSTFNVSIPFKDTLMGMSVNEPVKEGIATIYDETPTPKKLLKRGEVNQKHLTSREKVGNFRFNPEKAKRVAIDHDKLVIRKNSKVVKSPKVEKKVNRFEPILEEGKIYSAREKGIISLN